MPDLRMTGFLLFLFNFVLFQLCANAGATYSEMDSSDVTGKLSKYVNYSDILEEDKEFTLESLTSGSSDFSDFKPNTFFDTKEQNGEPESGTESSTWPADFEFPVKHNASREGRIVTQTAAALGDYPYYVLVVVQLATGRNKFCGGAILSESWVVTAAQCIYSATTIQVAAGMIDLTTTPPVITRGTAVVHPGFKLNYLIHDIGLIKIATPFTFSSTVYPIKLAKKDYGQQEVTVRIMGFGPASDSGTTIGDLLNYVDLVNLNKANCKQQTKEIWVEYPNNVGCLSSSANTKGFCLGDTGGPIIYTFATDVSVSLMGLASIYQGCPSAYPMAYTRIGPYVGWIKSYVKKLLT